MSEHKPITGELRGRMNTLGWYDKDGSIVCTTGGEPASEIASLVINSKTFGELCDAIDAVHANLERENAELKAELDRVQGEQEDRRSCIYYDPKRNYCSCHDIDTDGLVEPPKDADKANICVGGKLDGYGKTIEVVELRHGRSGWVLISREGNAYADTYAFSHHHAPTVEGVLRGVVTLCRNTWKEGSAFEFYDVDDVMKSGNIAEYAAKLRLSGDAE